MILIINSCLCRGLGSALSKEAVATEPFILCFRSKVHPPCPEQQQVYHKAFAGCAVCRGRYYSPSGSLCKCAAVTGIAEPGAGIRAAGDAICACHPRPGTATGLLWGRASQQTQFSVLLQICGVPGQAGASGAASFGGDQSLRLHHFTFLITPPAAICWEEMSVTDVGAGTETPANLRRAPGCTAPSRRALRRRCLKHTELLPPHKATGAQVWPLSPGRAQEQPCSSASHPICMRNLASPRAKPSKPWAKAGMEVSADRNTVVTGVVGNSHRVKWLPVWRGSQEVTYFGEALKEYKLFCYFYLYFIKGNESWRTYCYWCYWIQDFTPPSHRTILRYADPQV